MPLPDYEFYTASYLGEKIPQESFARFITRAARQLERYKSMFDVRPRAGLQEPEACALCAMADAMYAFAEEDKRCRVVSASVGSVSETYAARRSSAPKPSRAGKVTCVPWRRTTWCLAAMPAAGWADGRALTVPPVLPDRYLLPCEPGSTYHHAHRCAGRSTLIPAAVKPRQAAAAPQAVRPRRFCWLSRKNMRRLAGIIRWNPMTACLQAPGRR